MSNFSPKARHTARGFALQALYQWHLAETPLPDLIVQTTEHNQHRKVEWSFFNELLTETIRSYQTLDEKIAVHLDRPADELTPIERMVLRLATYEFCKRIEIPYKVVIDEYVSITSEYGTAEGHKYVNGVLEELAADLRKMEVDAQSKS